MVSFVRAFSSALRMASASFSAIKFFASSFVSFASIAGDQCAARYSRIFFRMNTPLVQT